MGEASLTYNPSIDNQIIKALKGFSIVESIIKTRNTLVIKVDNEQWITLDKVQKNIFTKTVHAFVNENITVNDIYIINKQGKKLVCLQSAETGNNYMEAAETITEKPETAEKHQAPFDLEKALSAEDTHVQNMAAVYVEGVEKPVSDFANQNDIPDMPVKEFAPESIPQPELHENLRNGFLYNLVIVFLFVLIVGVVGYYLYYFSFKEREQAEQWTVALPAKIAPVRKPQPQIDKKNQIPIQGVQIQKPADTLQTELSKKDASQPVAAPASLPASQIAAAAASREEPPPLIQENKPAEPAQSIALVNGKPAQPPAKVKKNSAPPTQGAAVKATAYCVNVALCKLKESADVVMRDLQKRGYDPAGDTITMRDTTWYRVTLGYFQTQGEAQNYARELQSRENIKGFVAKKK